MRSPRRWMAAPALLMALGAGAAFARQEELRTDEVARAFLDAYNAHDVKRLMELYAEGIAVSTPDLTVVRGRPANQKYYEAWFKSVPDVRSQLKSLTVEDNRFVLELVETGTYREKLPTPTAPPARGQRLRYPYVIVATVKNGRMTTMRIYENDLLIEKQLGIRR